MNSRIRKIRYYSRVISEQFLIPNTWYRTRCEQKLRSINRFDFAEVQERVSYYNQLTDSFDVSDTARSLHEIPFWKKTMSYYDYREILRHFPAEVRTDFFFGDVNWLSDTPTLVKARPIDGNNTNCVLLNMRKVRHFFPIKDQVPFAAKSDQLVWRGAAWQPHRKKFLEQCIDHPLCDVGQVNPESEQAPAHWVKPYLSISEQLKSKFIMSIEGHDVATNLKWISQSNSVCVMTRPQIDDWFMAAKLKPFEHYIEVADDYSDLTEKLEYYLRHPRDSEQIASNFQAHYRRFTDQRLEELIGMLVIRKYLEKSSQLEPQTIPAFRGGVSLARAA